MTSDTQTPKTNLSSQSHVRLCPRTHAMSCDLHYHRWQCTKHSKGTDGVLTLSLFLPPRGLYQKRGLLSGLDQTGGEKSNISMENDKFQPSPELERSALSRTEACVWRGELKRPPFLKYEKNKACVKKMSVSVPRNKSAIMDKKTWNSKK